MLREVVHRILERLGHERSGVEALARHADGINAELVRSHIDEWVALNPQAQDGWPARWPARFLHQPMRRLESYEACRHECEALLETERHELVWREEQLLALQERYRNLPIGDRRRPLVEEEAKGVTAEVELIHAEVRALDQQLEEDPKELLVAARVGLARYLEVVFEFELQRIREPLAHASRRVAEAMGELLTMLWNHERLVAEAERQTGQPLSIRRPRHPGRRELEAAYNAGMVVEFVRGTGRHPGPPVQVAGNGAELQAPEAGGVEARAAHVS